MSAKTEKVYRKQARKEAQAELQILDRLLKPKPWWFPTFVWRRLAGLFFDIPNLTSLFKK